MFDMYARRRLTALLTVAIVGLLGLRFAAPGEGAQPPRPYTVQPGDTLWGIASSHYGGDTRRAVARIQGENRVAGDLQPGMVLLLPRSI